MSTDLPSYILNLGQQAAKAAALLANLPRKQKDAALLLIADYLEAYAPELLEANKKDIATARERGLSDALIDRLKLTSDSITSMANGVRKVATLDDPIGEIIEHIERPNGLHISKVRVPIGVIGIIYESRPNVTADASALCLKAGNAVILKGGSDAIHSNAAIAHCIKSALRDAHLPESAIQLVESTDREAVIELCHMDNYLDLIIPRGGKSLIQTVVSHARMPVIKHYDGICHLYIDATADLNMALDIADDAKTQRPGVCNAIETLLVHRDIAPDFLPLLAARMNQRHVQLRACEYSIPFLTSDSSTPPLPATEEDWKTEYLDLILSVKTVNSPDDAIAHINHYSSHHSESIITTDADTARYFMSHVHSACVYHNASTRFSDGEEYGFGAEIGISTDKLHARGPMGLRELTSYQYRVSGNGQVKDANRL